MQLRSHPTEGRVVQIRIVFELNSYLCPNVDFSDSMQQQTARILAMQLVFS
jgi:hypothetical protein